MTVAVVVVESCFDLAAFDEGVLSAMMSYLRENRLRLLHSRHSDVEMNPDDLVVGCSNCGTMEH